MGLTVRREEDGAAVTAPGAAARKRSAVELIRSHGTVLRSTARRYSICADDADDAYQRGIEILLSKAPTTDARQLVPWARTVIKHEALAIRRTRERMLGRPASAAAPEEEQDWVQLIPSTGAGPDELAESREKVARSREALGQLKPAELRALTLLAEGYSYAEIGSMNDWTRTKVNRCLAEGRQRFRSAFRESEAGERCGRFEPLLSACCDGELDQGRRRELEDHLAACGHCRATLRTYRAAPRAAVALAPAAPASQSLWDRVQELAISMQTKVQGLGGDGSAGGAFAAGGTRGAGAAVLAKAAALCAGTAGTAAVCVATGVLPGPVLAPHGERDAPPKRVERNVAPASSPAAPVGEATPVAPVAPDPPIESRQPVRAKPKRKAQQPRPAEPAPPPTPIESEFTPEAAGTPAPAAAPPPAPPSGSGRSGSGGGDSAGVPVGNGGGEFAP